MGVAMPAQEQCVTCLGACSVRSVVFFCSKNEWIGDDRIRRVGAKLWFYTPIPASGADDFNAILTSTVMVRPNFQQPAWRGREKW